MSSMLSETDKLQKEIDSYNPLLAWTLKQFKEFIVGAVRETRKDYLRLLRA